MTNTPYSAPEQVPQITEFSPTDPLVLEGAEDLYYINTGNRASVATKAWDIVAPSDTACSSVARELVAAIVEVTPGSSFGVYNVAQLHVQDAPDRRRVLYFMLHEESARKKSEDLRLQVKLAANGILQAKGSLYRLP